MYKVESISGIDKALLIIRDEMEQESELIERLIDSDVFNVPSKPILLKEL